MRVLVIGVGTGHGDDAAGPLVARALREDGPHPDVEVVVCESPADLPARLRGGEQVLLVDATRSVLPPGTVHRIPPEALAKASPRVSTHGFGVAEAFSLARALGRSPARLEVLGVEAACAEGPPSAALRAALPEAVRRARELCGAMLRVESSSLRAKPSSLRAEPS